MNGRYEFSAASPGPALRPAAAEQTETLSNPKRRNQESIRSTSVLGACAFRPGAPGRKVENGFFGGCHNSKAVFPAAFLGEREEEKEGEEEEEEEVLVSETERRVTGLEDG